MSQIANSSFQKYRLDIQGMRALAVLLVFFSHAGNTIFQGGFVGVDVFFVISGYVITQLIILEYRSDAKFNFIKFYVNRLKRLLPALVLMVLVTSVLLLCLLPESIYLEQVSSSLSAVGWFSNMYFLLQSQDYFLSWNSSANFFLHTWSLGVEEQFYLFWPVLIVLSFWQKTLKNGFIVTVSLLAVSSIILHWLVSSDSDLHSFYLMPTRIWQFSLGGLAAYISIHSSSIKVKSMMLSNFGYLLGFTLIMIAATQLDETYRYPYWYVMFPTVGTFIVLICHNQNNSYFAHALSIKPMVWLGDRSYSFYLWHWPVILLFDQFEINTGWMRIAMVFLTTLLFSIISYGCLENPIRKFKPQSSFRKQLLWIVAVLLVICFVILVFEKIARYKESKNTKDEYLHALYDKPIIYNKGCDTWYESSELTICQFGNETAENTVVLFGDSILSQWFAVLEKKYAQDNWNLVVLTKSACPIIDEPYYYEQLKRNFKVCEIWRSNALRYISEIKPQLVVMGNSVSYPFSQDQWQSGSRRILSQLTMTGAEIKLVAGTPSLGFNGPLCLRNQSKYNRSCQTPLIPLQPWSWLEEVADEFSEVDFIEFSEYICPNNTCQALIGEQVVYSDDKHLTDSFVQHLYNQVKEKF